MSPKEKAKQLIEKFHTRTTIMVYENILPSIYTELKTTNSAKKDALLCADEVLDELNSISDSYYEREFWEEVKQELEKL